jgi:hypothetical protein
VLQNNASVRVVHRSSGFDFGEFRTRTGGGKTGDNQLVRPGGMAPPIAMPGTYGFDDLTCARIVQFEKDSGLAQKALDMHGERVDVTHQPADAKGRTGFHRPVVYTGLVNAVTPPEYDADSNDPATLEFVITVDGIA